MVFSSHLFIFFFLPASLLLYYSLPGRFKHFFLTIASYVFYGWSNPAFMTLMMISTLIDYAAGLVISGAGLRGAEPQPLELGGARSGRQKIALAASVCSNLSLLGFFKYFNFATESYNDLMGFVGLPDLRIDHLMRVTLPLGISFYTFQTMSYTIDVYRGHARALRSFVDFACFVSMFPQLVAGPIIRFSDVAEQLRSRSHTIEKFARGVAFFSLGMAKKILIANPCGKVADTVFDAAAATTLDAWYGLIAYAFQIYFDFSGYSDMAIGLGLMFGFVFAKNFDSPYKSESITDFWRRWHISLSSWLRDYLYLPLGGNRKGEARTYANLAAVMLLGGLWHGAAWNFIIWGGIHGAWLGFERRLGKVSFYRALPRPARIASTFAIVLLSWVFFRSRSVGEALAYLAALLGVGDAATNAEMLGGIIHKPYYVVTVAVAGFITWLAPQTWDWTRSLSPAKVALCLVLLWLSIVVMSSQAYNPFIYFIF